MSRSVRALTFRVFNPFYAYLQYLRRNRIPFKIIRTKDGYEYIEFSAHDRFSAKEEFVGLCATSGYIFETRNGQEIVLQWF